MINLAERVIMVGLISDHASVVRTHSSVDECSGKLRRQVWRIKPDFQLHMRRIKVSGRKMWKYTFPSERLK